MKLNEALLLAVDCDDDTHCVTNSYLYKDRGAFIRYGKLNSPLRLCFVEGSGREPHNSFDTWFVRSQDLSRSTHYVPTLQDMRRCDWFVFQLVIKDRS